MDRTQHGGEASHLRAGVNLHVLRGGMPIADGLFVQRHVSVGRSPHNDIAVVDDDALPRRWPLFHRHGDGYALRFTDAMHGSVARAPGATEYDLREVHRWATPHGRAWDIDLAPGAHGQLEVGRETIQFAVEPLPDEPLGRPWWPWIEMAVGLLALGLVGAVATLVLPPGDSAVPPPMPPPTVPVRWSGAVAPPPIDVQGPSSVRPLLPPLIIHALRPIILPPAAAAPAPAAAPSAPAPLGRVRAAWPPVAVAPAVVTTGPRSAAERAPAGDHSAYRPDGTLSPEEVALEIGRRDGAVRAAYERELRDDPTLAGTVRVRLFIGADGWVTRARVEEDGVGLPRLARRIEGVLGGWRLPAPAGGPVEVVLPFELRPAAARR